LSDESLASPEKKQRERRIRSGTTDTDVGKKTRLLYARTLARSVVKKQASRAVIDVVSQEEVQQPAQALGRKEETPREEALDVEADEEEETSLLCENEEHNLEEREIVQTEETDDEDEDEGPVEANKQQRRQPYTRRVDSDSEEEESEQALLQPTSRKLSGQITKLPIADLQPQTSMRPPHRKGHSTFSNWPQEVIDLTSSSPEAPSSFVLPVLSPPTRTRTASLASSRPQTSSSIGNGALAILTYSPTPTKLRSPCKAPPIARPATPPLEPPSPSKLVSPSKKKPTIPKAHDLRPSLDAFWNPEVVNQWNEHHSPMKPLVSPKKQKWRDDIVKMMDGIALSDNDSSSDAPSPTTSPRKKATRSPTKKLVPPPSEEPDVKALRATRKAFAERKHALALSFLQDLDTTICSGRIASLSASTGGIKLIWSKTLKTTAGRATWKREQVRLRTGPNASDFEIEIRHHCTIDLAEKVIDDESRLYNVLAHEFCHLATFMISEVRNNPHGAEFKSWGRKISTAFSHKGVEVTTKHSYQIEYKYIWECVVCGYEFKRQSKSVDTQKHSCGKCKGRLVQTKPVPRGVDGVRKEGEYQLFVKETFGRVKREILARGEDGSMGKVMEAVAREYREMKARKEGGSGSGGLEEALEGLKL
jgi:predicted SprT family Zn-dependent metalloprotease